MNITTRYAIDNLLVSSEKQALSSLGGPLKDRVVNGLLSQGNNLSFEIAKKTLAIIAHSEMSQARDNFLVHLLKKVSGKTKESLIKVMKFVKEGVFEEFIHTFDLKKKEYHSYDEIVRKINFFEKMVSHSGNRDVSTTHQTTAIPYSCLAAYQELQACSCYYTLPKIAEKYAKTLGHKSNFSFLFYKKKSDFLFQRLGGFYENKFENYEKVYLVKLIFRLIEASSCGEMAFYSEMDLNEFLSLAYDLKRNGGEEVLNDFFVAVNKQALVSLDEMIRALQLLNSASQDESFHLLIENWKKSSEDWTQLFKILESFLVEHTLEDPFFQEDIDEHLTRFAEDPTVKKPLSQQDLSLIGQHYEIVNDFCRDYRKYSFHQLMNEAHQLRNKAKNQQLSEKERLQLVAIGRLAIRLQFGIYPYSTQILALLGVLLRDESKQAQVKTGEGKSMIFGLYGFVMAMECRAVDIITSARYLAKRDQEKFVSFFKRCGISSSHICYDKKEPSHFRAQILYAPAFDFEFAWMGDQLWGTKLYEERLKVPFVKRNFDCVCVDESDNLLIDTAANGARLAFPAKTSYDWIYAPILSFVKLKFKSQISSSERKKFVDELRDFICLQVNAENQLICREIPDKQIKIWLESAFRAFFGLKENTDYVIKSTQNSKGKVETRNILIVDLQTGRISENSRWSNGTHEFLEVKHDITVEKESLNPISLSHATFYGFYKTITALTGTAESGQTEKVYTIQTFHVPPHRPLKRKDLPATFANDTLAYQDFILEETKKYMKLKRPLLILCETIKDSFLLKDLLERASLPSQLLNEVQEEEEHLIISKAGAPGKVTIATNTAGRGTDIILEQESLQNGGLHVLVTFFPSEREEQQAIGRAGRQGQPGSSQMILNRECPSIRKKLLLNNPLQMLLPDVPIQMLYSVLNLNGSELELLNQNRLIIAEQQALQHSQRAHLERYLSEHTQLFFDAFRIWLNQVNQDVFLDTQSQCLCKTKLNAHKRDEFDFSHLKDSELKLAEESKRLLTEEVEWLAWKIFLKTVIEKIKQKVMTEWSLEFFQPIEQKVKDHSGTEDSLKTEITLSFNLYRQNWERYLNCDGSGIFLYLEELTNIPLKLYVG